MRQGNYLLDLLPVPYRTDLMARMETVPLQTLTHLYEAGKQPQFAHFVVEGAVSIALTMDDGDGVEVALVGNEGLVEAYFLLGRCMMITRAFVQVPGTALRIRLSALRDEFRSSEPLRNIVLAHVQSRCTAADQIAGCNRMHQVEPRLARWLLSVTDRVGQRPFAITQELLARSLGTRRSTVTVAACHLQELGAIEYTRGRMLVTNRGVLEQNACECYSVLHGLLPTR